MTSDKDAIFLEQARLGERNDVLIEFDERSQFPRMRRLYKRRRDAMLEALDRHFGGRALVRGDAAGLHMTVRFTSVRDLRARAERAGVHISSSDIYYMNRTRPSAGTEYIFGFAAVTEGVIRESIRRLAVRD